MKNDEIDFDIHSDRDLVTLKEEVKAGIAFIEQENRLFQSYILRVNPNALRSSEPAGALGEKGIGSDVLQNQPGNASSLAARKKKDGGKKAGDDSRDKPLVLTAEQKSEVATRELEELRDEIEKRKDDWGRVLDNLRAEMEEVDIRVTEVKKATFEFKRDIIGQAVNARTGKVMAERILRYYEDKIRAKDTIIEKVRLKNATLKVHKNKLHLQLKQKEEMGEVLHVIDFDQLQIENKQYQTKIEERNGELLKLKKSAGRTVQILNFHKKKLSNLTRESIKLANEINSRKDLLSRLLSEAGNVELEREQARQFNASLRKEIAEFKVPHVMDYVEVKAKQQELSSQLKSWERKVEIAAMQTSRVKNIWGAMVKSRTVDI
ncbi:MAG: hypothetical protein SGCHY_003014 [Lobulomycetales sp.]